MVGGARETGRSSFFAVRLSFYDLHGEPSPQSEAERMPDDVDQLAARLSVELIRLGFARARMTREPWRAVMPISAAHGVLLAGEAAR